MTDIVQELREAQAINSRRMRLAAADEIERLRAEVDRIRAGGCARDQRTTQWCAEAEALRADAERYRWLRESDGLTIRAAAARTPEAFDAAIDAARSAK